VLGIAQSMGINLRWGGDWDKDWEVQDNKFDDFPHFEKR
jgi:peptidoglycan L-alanyl-D-glutamate endopeptidase CwlK